MMFTSLQQMTRCDSDKLDPLVKEVKIVAHLLKDRQQRTININRLMRSIRDNQGDMMLGEQQDPCRFISSTVRNLNTVCSPRSSTDLTCNVCHKTRKGNLECLPILPIPMPHHQFETQSVTQCLRNYLDEDWLTDDNKVHCEDCQANTVHRQQVSLHRTMGDTPILLVIQLKRFSQQHGRLSKNQSDVSVQRQLTVKMREGAVGLSVTMQLCSMQLHYGGLHNGHFVAVGINKNTTYIIDDQNIEENNQFINSAIFKQSVYLLYYEEVARIHYEEPVCSGDDRLPGSEHGCSPVISGDDRFPGSEHIYSPVSYGDDRLPGSEHGCSPVISGDDRLSGSEHVCTPVCSGDDKLPGSERVCSPVYSGDDKLPGSERVCSPVSHHVKKPYNLRKAPTRKRFSENWHVTSSESSDNENGEKNTKGILLKRSVDTLKPGCWLNDEVINSYMALLQDLIPEVYAMSSFFFTKIDSNGVESIKNWIKNIHGETLLLIPVNRNCHWTLFVIDMAAKCIKYLDSLGQQSFEQFYTDIETLWNVVNKLKRSYPTEWKFLYLKDIPKQKNLFDCGVFVCKYAQLVSMGQPVQFSKND